MDRMVHHVFVLIGQWIFLSDSLCVVFRNGSISRNGGALRLCTVLLEFKKKLNESYNSQSTSMSSCSTLQPQHFCTCESTITMTTEMNYRVGRHEEQNNCPMQYVRWTCPRLPVRLLPVFLCIWRGKVHKCFSLHLTLAHLISIGAGHCTNKQHNPNTYAHTHGW